jgi:hypothetical protein
MHYITGVRYVSGFELHLQFEDGGWRVVDLEPHLDGEVFEPLRDRSRFGTARLNPDIDTVVWDNGADMSPDFLYEISVPADDAPLMKVAEEQVQYKTRNNPE